MIYIAAPFFNTEQSNMVEYIKMMLNTHRLKYFSPKDECMFENIKDTPPKAILQMNCESIDLCNGMIAVTNGKDVGTMFEAGYAYACGVPLHYLWLGGNKEEKFNLMLGGSAKSISFSYADLERNIVNHFKNGDIIDEADWELNYE